jgi:MtN3 and saliva related transmembrane protein
MGVDRTLFRTGEVRLDLVFIQVRGIVPAMTFDISSMIGALAAITSTASFAPQAWKIIKTRETKDLSTVMYSLTVLGFALWSAYGVMLGKWPLIACNSICLLLALFILVMKVLPASAKRKVADKLDPSDEHS